MTLLGIFILIIAGALWASFGNVDYRVRQYTVSCTPNVVFTFCCSMLTIIFFFAFSYL